MGDVVIVAYRPKPGRAADLLALAKQHLPILRQLGLATDRPEVILQAKDGVIVEVFEWRDGAIEAAHSHPEIAELWRRYGEVCDYVPLKDLPETSDLFATFKPI